VDTFHAGKMTQSSQKPGLGRGHRVPGAVEAAVAAAWGTGNPEGRLEVGGAIGGSSDLKVKRFSVQ
jgi:hypothetical protein